MGLFKSLGGLVGGTLIFALFILNTFGAVVGGIWLLFLGEWRLVVCTFLASLFVPILFALITFPMMGLAALCLKTSEKGRLPLTGFLGFIFSTYQNATLSFWAYIVFCFFSHLTLAINPVPLLLWGYGIATGPIFYTAAKEGPDSGFGTSVGCLMVMLTYILLTIFWVFSVPVHIAIIVLVALVCIAALLVSVLSILVIREQQKSEQFSTMYDSY